MQDDLNKFKQELQWLVGKQAEAAPPPASASSVGIFDKFIEEDKRRDFYAEELARIASINAVEKACPSCYLRQALEQKTCPLCGAKPEIWLASKVAQPRSNHLGNIIDDQGNVIASGRAAGTSRRAVDEGEWLRWATTSATSGDLTYFVSRFSAPDDGWKVKHAARILRLRGETVPQDFYGQPVDTGYIRKPVAEPPENVAITEHQVESAMSYLDIKLKKIEAEQEELRKKREAA